MRRAQRMFALEPFLPITTKCLWMNRRFAVENQEAAPTTLDDFMSLDIVGNNLVLDIVFVGLVLILSHDFDLSTPTVSYLALRTFSPGYQARARCCD